MHKFVRNLITEWRRIGLPFSGEKVVVAVSGGADSTALLLAIADLRKRKKLGHEIIAAHFNHRLRGKESDADEKFICGLAGSLGFEFVVGIDKLADKSNLEQRARDSRYEFMTKTAKNHDSHIVLTAHTMNDQAETFLINLIRGSGGDGLKGMMSVRPINNLEYVKSRIELVRPLLCWAKRPDTETFCRDQGVAFRHDSMNEDQAFTRVRIRKTVLPVLAEINPKIVETLCRTAELLRQKSEPGGVEIRLVQEEEKTERSLKVNALKLLPKTVLYTELRSWLKEKRGNLRGLQLKHIEAIERLIHSRKSGRTTELPGGVVVKQAGTLHWRQIKVEK